MGFQVSPGVAIQEIDLTGIVPAVSTTEAAIGGVFDWGPIEARQLVTSEAELVAKYGRPNSGNFETWLSASSFLAYGNELYVSRAASNTAMNAVAFGTANGDMVQIKNKNDYIAKQGALPANSHFYAKYAGALGNSLRIATCASPSQYTSNLFTSNTDTAVSVSFSVGSNSAVLTAVSAINSNTIVNTHATAFLTNLSVGDYVQAGNTIIGQQFMKVTAKSVTTVTANGTATATISLDSRYGLSDNTVISSTTLTASNIRRYWEFFNLVDVAPTTSTFVSARNVLGSATLDELHVIVVDKDGKFTGLPGTVLEVWKNISRATDALGEQGGSIYYRNILNDNSKFVWYGNTDAPGVTSAIASAITPVVSTIPYTANFVNGSMADTETNIPINSLARAYDQFTSAAEVDVSLIIQGKARGGVLGEQLANYIIDNICETRKDCVLLVSPPLVATVNNAFSPTDDVIAFRNVLRSSSYFMIDSGHKYTYDRYNDVYRWVPLCGDVAGAIVRTDDTRDPWWSPGGFTRGNIKNVVQLAFNPNKAQRDQLYKAGVNPIVSFPGQGVVLYGDKTGLAKPSAFDRINVRRLFIVLEKAIATAAKFTLFEFNDEFTRAQFKSMVEPYLRDIQGRRGISAFKVICDTTNNTNEVIDSNRFVADIRIAPARSINFIQLNFIATRTGEVEFNETSGISNLG